jgi:ACS family glucarate transporter-like MFS transporter
LPLRWLLIFWIFLMSSVAYLDRVNISIAGKAIATEFGLSHTQLGYVFSAFLLGYAFFQAPAGRVADRLGPRLVLMVSVIWWAFFTVAITILPTGLPAVIFVLIGIRFCLGIGEAVMYPASNSFVSAWIPSSERGIANGFIFAGVGFGAGVTSPLITYLMIHFGWRAAFYVSALIGLAAGSIWYALARNRPREHPWMTGEEAAFIEAGLPAVNKGKEQLPWLAILADPNVLALTFSYFSFGYVAQIFFNWFFIYLNEVRGLDLRQSSLYTMLPFIAMSVCSVVGGLASDYLTRAYGKRVGRCGVAIFGIGLCALFIVFGSQVASPQLASVVLAGGAGSLYLAQSSFWSVSADIGGKSAGSLSGVMNMGAQLGGALTASLTPAIAARFGWNASFLVAAGLAAAGAVVWVVVDEGRVRGVRRHHQTASDAVTL